MENLALFILILILCVVAIAAPAPTFTTGTSPYGPLVQGIDGNLYGSNFLGAPAAHGTIFRITPEGTISAFYSFHGQNGEGPSGLVLELTGNLYGTTGHGRAPSSTCPSPNAGCGTVFGFTSAGVHFTLHSFNGLDGMYPTGGLTLGPDGSTLYGATSGTRRNGVSGPVYGTIFKISPTGSSTLLHKFNYTDGAYPAGPLVLGTNGNLQGTTTEGGTYGGGTVFMIPKARTFTSLHSFISPDGGSTDGSVGASREWKFLRNGCPQWPDFYSWHLQRRHDIHDQPGRSHL